MAQIAIMNQAQLQILDMLSHLEKIKIAKNVEISWTVLVLIVYLQG